MATYFASMFGGNSRGVAKHSKALGWNPKKGTREMLANVIYEVEGLLKEEKK